jgi:ABC-type multidrug transport system fused ATPase/permease subunit
MKSFRRVLKHVWPQWKLLAISFVCVFFVSALYALSLGMMLPFLKVLIEEEGLHDWVYRGVIQERSGLVIDSVGLGESRDVTVLTIRDIVEKKEKTPAQLAGMKPNDEIAGMAGMAGGGDRVSVLEYLATCDPSEPLKLDIIRTASSSDVGSRKPLTLELRLEKEPFWSGMAYYVLRFCPKDVEGDVLKTSILVITIIIFIMTVLRCFFRFFQEYLVRRVSQRSVMQLRHETFQNAMRLPLNYYSAHGTSDAMSRFLQDSNKINNGISILFGKAAREPVKLVMMLWCAFLLNARITSYMLLVAPLVVITILLLGRQLKKATKRELEGWASILARIKESLLSIRIVKAYHREDYEEQRFETHADRLLQRQFRIAKLDSASGPLLETLGTLAGCFCMVAAASWISSKELSPSEFTTLLAFLGAAAESGRKMGNVVTRLNIANAAAERVYELVDAPCETDNPQAVPISPLRETLQFENLSFSYPNSLAPALVNVDLTVAAGQRIAVVGPNGSGKTTLLSMIPRFFEPASGRILIDGQNIAHATLASLREQIGVVTQQTVVFNDSIFANIAYGNLEASESDVTAAAKKAYAHEFIEQTEEGYETIIGEQGATLSGGQLQRLAIARAILRDPAILIFDEATSQIDSDSETKIQRALAEFTQSRTSFIIAHRLSTIVDADKIVVMDAGRIVAEGQHKPLLASCPLYRQLYETQFNEAG